MTTHAWRYTVDHFLLLPIGGLVALVWANALPDSYFTLAHALRFPVNEIGMALFFALMAQEVVEATMPHGALHTWRKWTLPVVAAIGAVAGAAFVYLVYVRSHYELALVPGWPVAAAIDLAFAYFVVRSIFHRHPAVSFLVVTAVVADLVAMLAVAGRHAFVDVRPGGVALMFGAIALAFLLRRWKVRSFWPYLLISGPLAWTALYFDGFHPAFALVPIVPFLPHRPRSLELFADAPHGAHDSPGHLEHVLGHPIQAVLFLFGLANAGVLLSGYGTGTWALLTAALVGKPLGMLAATALAVALGLHLPARLHWRDLVVVGVAASGVFTFGLFFATSAFPIGPLLGELKLGAILSGIGVPLAFAVAWLLRAGHFAHDGHHHHAPHRRARTAAATILLLAITATPAAGQFRVDDGALAVKVADRLRQYVFFTIFDDVEVVVENGVVTLSGCVTRPFKGDDFAYLASRVPGVKEIRNDLETLPVSQFDDRLRYTIARGIYDDPLFAHYAMLINPPIHIIVRNGHVTLTGVVVSEVERRSAEMIARSSLAFSVTNKLQLETED